MMISYNLCTRIASLFLFCIFLSPNLLSAQNFNRTTDSLALVALYNATDGPNWTNTWDLGQPMSTWYGIQLNASGRVEIVDLDGDTNQSLPNFWRDGNNLTGTIPADLWNISRLKILSLSRNTLTGTIPSSINNLQELEILSLYGFFSLNEGLSGTIPSEIGNLINLRQLFLGENSFSGPIPETVSSLKKLEYFSVEDNNFTTLPDLSDLINLKILRIGGNSFPRGPIPDWFYELRNLEDFFAYAAGFTGEISPKIGQLSKLEVLSLRSNNLTGSIPAELGDLSNLFLLLLGNNQLTGSIPVELTNINIGRLIVNNNQLSGTIPDFSKSSRFYDFDISNNQFIFDDIVPHIALINNAIVESGRGIDYEYAPQANIGTTKTVLLKEQDSYTIDLEIDEDVSTNAYVWYKDGVFHTRLVGNNKLDFRSITAADAGVYHCEITNPAAPDLLLISNPVTIQVINDLCRNRDSLILIDLYNATNGPNWTNTWNLNQPIENWYGVEVNTNGCVNTLDFDGIVTKDCEGCSNGGNNLVGTIPSSIWNLDQSVTLSFSHNDIDATIPDKVGELIQLEVLKLEGISGTIPSSISKLEDLKHIDFSGKNITGDFPYGISTLIKLETFYINGETINSGPFPDLSNLKSLQFLHLIDCNITGPTPSGFSELSNLISLTITGNRLDQSILTQVSQLPNLSFLSLADNQISGSIPADLGNLTQLFSLRLSGNNLSGSIPPTFNNMTNLISLYLSDNQLSGPISNIRMDNLERLQLQNNQLTFDDLLNISGSALENYQYSPQQQVFQATTFSKNVGEDFAIDLNFDATISDNVYTWYKDNQAFTTTTGSNSNLLFIEDLKTKDAGIYHFEVSNPRLPNLVLRSYNITLQIIGNDPIDEQTDVFSAFPWLSLITSPDNCTDEKITVYETGIYTYLLIENSTGQKLYNQDGQLYCTNAPNYDCVAAFNLSKVTEWICGSATTIESPSTPEPSTPEPSTPEEEETTSTLFDEYTWLTLLVDPNSCSNTQIRVYQTGPFQYLFVTIDGASILYNETGQLYCTEAPNFDCVAAFNLTEVIATWSCGDAISESNTDDENGGITQVGGLPDDPLFNDYPWLIANEELAACPEEFAVTEFQVGIYSYLLVEIPSTGSRKLYNEDGQLYCTSAPNYNCLTAYNLDAGAFHLYTCGNNNIQQPIDNNVRLVNNTPANNQSLKVFPNPASNQVFVELPNFSATATQSIQLLDISGRILLETAPTGATTQLPIYDIASGVYFVQWTTAQDVQTLRLVIE